MAIIKVPLGPYRPDVIEGGNICKNVLPLLKRQEKQGDSNLELITYGPMRSPTAYSANALYSYPRGLMGVKDSDGNNLVFAADANTLYQMAPGSLSWVDVSKTSLAYDTQDGERWFATQFGDYVLFTNFNDPIQVFDTTVVGNFDDLSADAPKARYISQVREWLVAANTYDIADENQPTRVWWSAVGDAGNWPTPGTDDAASVSSGWNNLPVQYGPITGIATGMVQADAVIFQTSGVTAMKLAGGSNVWNFDLLEGARGCVAPGSIVSHGGYVYYLGVDGWYRTNGVSSEPIGLGRVDKTFYTNVALPYLYRLTSTVDPIGKNIFWSYVSNSSPTNRPDKILIYNWGIDEWAELDLELEFIGRSYTIGYTLESLDSLGFTIDTLPFSLDSRVWMGGEELLAGFNYDFKLVHFAGASLAPEIATSEFEPNPEGRAIITMTRPMADGSEPTITVGSRERKMAPISYKNPSSMNRWGFCPQLISGRYFRAKLAYPANSDVGKIDSITVEVQKDGYI